MKILWVVLFGWIGSISFLQGHNDPIDELKKVAIQFVQVVDDNDSEQLKKLLHSDMVQYVQMGPKLIPFKANDFIQMVADKKIGGHPRKISFHAAEMHRGQAGSIQVQAVSDEYDFMYHLNFAKSADKWIIVGIVVDIVEV